MTYKELLESNKDEKKKDAAQLAEQVESAKIQIQADILQQRKALNSAEKSYKATLIADNFDSVNIVNAKRQVEDEQENLNALEQLQVELFGGKKA